MDEKQIVCISTHYWQEAWFRKQHFMSRFAARGYKVAYIEPSCSMVRQLPRHVKSLNRNKINKVVIEKAGHNIFIIKPPLAIPFSRSIKLINQLNSYYFVKKINKTLKKLNFNNYILWLYDPDYSVMLDHFNFSRLVFDLVDDIASYYKRNSSRYKITKRNIEALVQKCDLFFTTAKSLYSDYKKTITNDKMYLIPNGYDSNIFNKKVYNVPGDLSNVKHPIIGFHGAIFEFLNYDLIEFIVITNPNKSFVFLGHVLKDVRDKWEKITIYKNVYWLGYKSQNEIPQYIYYFDVCINPFKVDDVSRSVSPLKVYEYLACNKPVVSVRMESLESEPIAESIFFANTYDEFNNLLTQASNSKSIKIHKNIIRNYSWDNLFEKVYEQTEILRKEIN